MNIENTYTLEGFIYIHEIYSLTASLFLQGYIECFLEKSVIAKILTLMHFSGQGNDLFLIAPDTGRGVKY